MLSVCALSKSEIQSSFSDASLNTLIQMSLAGMGTTLVPKMALEQIGEKPFMPYLWRNLDLIADWLFITRLNYARVNDVRLLSEIFGQALASLRK